MKTGDYGWPLSPIARHRAELGYATAEAAWFTGVPVERWAAIESGAAAAVMSEISAIAAAFDMTTGDLVAEIGAHPVPQSRAEAWGDERIAHSLLVKHLGNMREPSR